MDNYIIDAALILALTEVIKRAVKLDSRFVPLVSIAFGLSMFFLTSGITLYSVFAGIVVGLAASGLYSSGKAVAGK